MRKSAGFSLVELLVALTIFSMVIVLASSAFSIFSKTWDGQLGKFDQKFHEIRVFTVVMEILENIVPYWAPNSSNKMRLFFEGNEQGFVAVSSNSFNSAGPPAVIRLSARQTKDFDYELIYEEYVLDGSKPFIVGEALPFSSEVILLDDLKNISFSYFGGFVNGSSNQEDAVNYKWTGYYNSVVTFFQPQKIKINWTSSNTNHSSELVIAMLSDELSDMTTQTQLIE